MTEPKLEVPAELRELADKTIDQAERAFGLFFDAARRSTATAPTHQNLPLGPQQGLRHCQH